MKRDFAGAIRVTRASEDHEAVHLPSSEAELALVVEPATYALEEQCVVLSAVQ